MRYDRVSELSTRPGTTRSIVPLAAPVQKPESAWSYTESCIQRISKSPRPAIVGNKRLAHVTNSLEADAALEEDKVAVRISSH